MPGITPTNHTMIANANQPELPAVDRSHPDHDANRELLCCLSPAVYVSLRAVGKTIGAQHDATVRRVQALRTKGYTIDMLPGVDGLYARVDRRSWPRVEAEALDYWHRRYGGER